MNKAQKITLIAGLILIAISFTMILIATYQYYSPNYNQAIEDIDVYKYKLFSSSFSKIILTKPIIILCEILWIKNIYTILATGQQEYRKLLCSISLVLLFGVVMLFCMYKTTYHRFDITNISYLYASWLVLIISLILSFIRKKKRNVQEKL